MVPSGPFLFPRSTEHRSGSGRDLPQGADSVWAERNISDSARAQPGSCERIRMLPGLWVRPGMGFWAGLGLCSTLDSMNVIVKHSLV